MEHIEAIYINIDNMTDKKFNEYKKTISKELAAEFKTDLFDNKGLDRFLEILDIMKISRCMAIADIAEK